MRDNIAEPGIVLAPDAVNTCIPIYSAQENVVSLRGMLPALERRAPGQIEVPRAPWMYASSSPTSGGEANRIPRSHELDYLMVLADSHLNEPLKRLSGLSAMDVPGERHNLYSVNRKRLGDPRVSPVDHGRSRDGWRPAGPISIRDRLLLRSSKRMGEPWSAAPTESSDNEVDATTAKGTTI